MVEASCNFYGTRVLVLFEIAVSYGEFLVVCRIATIALKQQGFEEIDCCILVKF